MRRVLIVSYHFPPVNRVASRRYGVMCKYLEMFGYEPYIITTNYDRTLKGNACLDLEIPVDKKKIIRIGTPKRNCEIESFFWNFVLDQMDLYKIESRTLSRGSIGWYEKVKRNLRLEDIKDVDIIIGTYPPMENLYVAAYLSRKLKCPYIVDIRDLISDYIETTPGYKDSRWLDQVLERKILREAEGIVTVTSGFRNILKKRYPDKQFKVVFNGWDERKYEEIAYEPKEKYLYYAGSLYLHRLESFELLMKCLKRVNLVTNERYKLIIRSIGPKTLDEQAKRMVQKEGMQEYIAILETVPEDIVKREQKQAYINVVLSTIHEDDEALMTTIPGKVYELLNERVPILAIVPKGSDVEKVLCYTDKGIVSTDEKEIVDFILGDHRQYRGNIKIGYFTRKKQAERLCRFMDKVLKNT